MIGSSKNSTKTSWKERQKERFNNLRRLLIFSKNQEKNKFIFSLSLSHLQSMIIKRCPFGNFWVKKNVAEKKVTQQGWQLVQRALFRCTSSKFCLGKSLIDSRKCWNRVNRAAIWRNINKAVIQANESRNSHIWECYKFLKMFKYLSYLFLKEYLW